MYLATLIRIPLEEGSVRRREIYLTTHKRHESTSGMLTHNASNRAAADRHLRRHGHRIPFPYYCCRHNYKILAVKAV